MPSVCFHLTNCPIHLYSCSQPCLTYSIAGCTFVDQSYWMSIQTDINAMYCSFTAINTRIQASERYSTPIHPQLEHHNGLAQLQQQLNLIKADLNFALLNIVTLQSANIRLQQQLDRREYYFECSIPHLSALTDAHNLVDTRLPNLERSTINRRRRHHVGLLPHVAEGPEAIDLTGSEPDSSPTVP